MDKWFDENERQNHNPHVRLVLHFVFLIAHFFQLQVDKNEKVKYTRTLVLTKEKILFCGTAGRCIQQGLQPIVDDCWDNSFLAHKLLSLLCFLHLFEGIQS